MPPTLQLHNGFARLPVTALAACGALLVAGEGPYLRFYHTKDSRYIASKRVFKVQAVHGIAVYSEEHDDVIKLVIWGGRLIRALEISISGTNDTDIHLDVFLSDVTKMSDWILDLAPCFSLLDEPNYQQGTFVAITAHNALVQITIDRQNQNSTAKKSLTLSSSELTSSSRSILYSAHVFCESKDCVLVAAGTAFGEIMYWSWNRNAEGGSTSRIHRVFLGHEGSIFGVRISNELPAGCCQSLTRIIASCSDDRSIRIWDVSDVNIRSDSSTVSDQDPESARTKHTGFSNASFDPKPFSSSQCLAVGWGHMSRVWTVRFLEIGPCEGAISLLSTGEDATSRTWKLIQNPDYESSLPYKLLLQDCAAYHSGKNIWSSAIYSDTFGRQRVVCGAADAKITTHTLNSTTDKASKSKTHEYSIHDILSRAQIPAQQPDADSSTQNHKSSKQAEFFRSYCFFDHSSFLYTTNSGKVFVSMSQSHSNHDNSIGLANTVFVDQPQDLSGYSTCVGETVSGVAFVASSTGAIYMFSKTSTTFSNIGSVDGKIGEMFAVQTTSSQDPNVIILLATVVGQKSAQLLFVDITENTKPHITRTVRVPISGVQTGSMVTSMTIASNSGGNFLCLGFRRGSVALFNIPKGPSELGDCASLATVMEKVHGVETVTALEWVASSMDSPAGYLLSVGRDGYLAANFIDLHSCTFELVYNLPQPIGPNIEGVYFHQDHLFVHGFSSKKWVLYDVTVEEEIMSLETGGAHRSWAFQSDPAVYGGGTLVWTRASSMHIFSQVEPNHNVIRPGGHGREIKAVAATNGPSPQLIATGAEDTDIKIFEYHNGGLICRRTLRRHTTGIQHLQWSEDNNYLFSSGGCEEFYVWRIRRLPSAMGIGIMCEHTYIPESEHSDLRIMSFDVMKRDTGYDIAMVFSDSSIKVCRYNPTAITKWQPLAKGLYSTSCLTQCVFLSPESVLTAGTDGYTTIWPITPKVISTAAESANLVPTLSWEQPMRIHQSSSKTMVALQNDDFIGKLVVSGGDDGSLAVLAMGQAWSSPSPGNAYATSPVLRNRAHASAITACATLGDKFRGLIVTAGNDGWVRLWEVCVRSEGDIPYGPFTKFGDSIVSFGPIGKIKTGVADVSSMTVLDAKESARVLICGVGMEIVRIEWDDKTGGMCL